MSNTDRNSVLDEPTDREALIASLENHAMALRLANPDDEMVQVLHAAVVMMETDEVLLEDTHMVMVHRYMESHGLAPLSPAVPPEPQCAMCNDSGVVGRHPDDFQECPDCIAARTAAQGAVPESLVKAAMVDLYARMFKSYEAEPVRRISLMDLNALHDHLRAMGIGGCLDAAAQPTHTTAGE